MDWSLFLILLFVLFVIVYVVLTFFNRTRIYQHWNSYLAREIKEQNETDRAFNNIPSLQSAWLCQNELARDLHRSIYLSHDEILTRVEDYFKTMIECAEEGKESTSKRQGRYFPFIINYKPTNLLESFSFKNISLPLFNFGLLILEPSEVISWRKDLSKGLYRYHYALRLPKMGEYGLYLRFNEDKESPVRRVVWKERQGFIWDATYLHHLANHSLEPCILLIADIPRKFSWKYHWINNLLHTYFPPLGDDFTIS